MLSLHTDIYLNQLAQGVKPLDVGEQWLAALPQDIQVNVLDRLACFVMQAQAVGGDAEEAIRRSKLKPGYTPCKVLSAYVQQDQKGGSALRVALRKIVGLPEEERRKSFVLLLALLAVADERRRSKHCDPQRHWWHRDLSDERVIDELLASQPNEERDE